MLVIETSIFYFLIGVGAAVAVFARGQPLNSLDRVFQTFAACLFWPLYVPMLLTARVDEPSVEESMPGGEVPPDDALTTAILQVETELDAALHSLDGWASNILSSDQYRLEELRSAWRLQAERIRELDRLLARPEAKPESFSLVTAGNERVRQSEQTRQDNLRRLETLRVQMHADLIGTLAWVRELVTMIHLAKFTGAPASSAEELVTQIAAAVEGLSEVSTWREERQVPVS